MRVRLSEKEFDELLEARDFCAQNGWSGFGGFYDDLLDFHAYRRTIPRSRMEPEHEMERDRR